MKQGPSNSRVGETKPPIVSYAVSPKEVARIGTIQGPGTRPAPACVPISVSLPTNTLTIHYKGTQK